MKREHTACEFKMDPSLPVLLVAERADSYGFVRILSLQSPAP